MAGKVYTVEFDNKKLSSTSGSKASKVATRDSEKEVETYGIVEINNNSAKKKVKNTNDVGFEKNVTGSEKKAVKSNLAQIDDYFDFSFRPCAKAETKIEVKVEKQVDVKVSAKKACVKKAVKESANKAVVEKKTEIIDNAKSCQSYTMSDEARKVVSVARAGSLFG